MDRVADYATRLKKLFERTPRIEVHVLYLFLATPIVTIFSLTLPLFVGFDEEFHIVRSWSVSTLKMYPSFEDGVPKSLANSMDYSMSLKPNYGNNINPTPFLFAKDYNRQLNSPEAEYYRLKSAKLDPSIQANRAGRSTGPYAPVPYIPSAIGFAVSEKLNLSVGRSVALARLVSGMVCVFIMAAALFFARKHKFKWVIFSVALLPSVLFQFSTITADSYTIAVAALSVSLILSSILSPEKRITRSRYIVIGGSLLLLSFAKINYVPFSLILMAIPLIKFHDSRKIAMSIKLALAVAPMIIAAALLVVYGSKDYYINHSGMVGLDQYGQLRHVLTDPLGFAKVALDTIYMYTWDWTNNVFGAFGWLYPAGPGGVGIVLSLLAFIISSAYAFVDFKIKTTVYMLIAGLVSVGSILLSLYMAYTPLDYPLINGIQGRYFIPILLVMGIAVARLIGLKIKNEQRSIGGVVTVIVVLSLSITLIETYRVLY